MILFHMKAERYTSNDVRDPDSAMGARPPAHGRCLSVSEDRLLAWPWNGFGDWRQAAISSGCDVVEIGSGT